MFQTHDSDSLRVRAASAGIVLAILGASFLVSGLPSLQAEEYPSFGLIGTTYLPLALWFLMLPVAAASLWAGALLVVGRGRRFGVAICTVWIAFGVWAVLSGGEPWMATLGLILATVIAAPAGWEPRTSWSRVRHHAQDPGVLRTALGGLWLVLAAFLALTAVVGLGVSIDLVGVLAAPTLLALALGIRLIRGGGRIPVFTSALLGLAGVLTFGFSALSGGPGFGYALGLMALLSLAIVAMSVSLAAVAGWTSDPLSHDSRH